MKGYHYLIRKTYSLLLYNFILFWKMETLIDITRPSSDSQTQRSQQDLHDKPANAQNKEFVKLV